MTSRKREGGRSTEPAAYNVGVILVATAWEVILIEEG